MSYRFLVFILSAILLTGCSSYSVGPISAGKNSYIISKQLSSFSSKEEEILAFIFSEANAYCESKKRYMKVEQLNEYIGLIGNDSKTTLVFSCLKEEVKVQKVKAVKKAIVAPAVKVQKQTFPTKSKLTNYAF